MTIRFFNYPARFAALAQRLPALITDHCESGQFILKQSVVTFERTLERYLQAKSAAADEVYCAATSSASSGMIIALKALGIGPGDEVITPAYSYVSSASAIASVGATPVFADVDPGTFMLSLQQVMEKITPRTKAVIAVHLYSHLMDIPALRAVLPSRVAVIEDSATCLGAVAEGCPAGLLGDIGVYSFFPAKPLGGLGDGGMIVTANKQLQRKCQMLRNHGQDGQVRFTHFMVGYNSRMDEINAAFLQEKLPQLDADNARRRAIASLYDRAVTGAGWQPQAAGLRADAVEEVPYSYVFLCPQAETLVAALQQQGIEAKRGFPAPLTAQPAFSPWVSADACFPCAHRIAATAVALPIYPQLSDDAVFTVIEALQTASRGTHD